MKVSKSAKEKTKSKILKEAVDLIIKKGFKNASMREIAKNAGVSNPTIYNYFPSKEKIIYAYIEQKHKETKKVLQNIPDFDTFTLREQLQTLIETQLEIFLEDREFVIEVFDLAFHSTSIKLEELYSINELFVEMVSEMLDIAIEAKEINEPPFKDYLPKLFWDYYISVVAYWVKDDSKMFENTTQYVDHSLGVLEALLESNILNKASDLGMFLFKTHVLSSLKKFSVKKSGFKGMKRKLFEGVLSGK